VWSGDDVADRAAFQRFTAEYDRAHRLEGGGGKVVLYVGDDDFPFPIPLVPDGPRWLWDTDAGDDELLNRRIGENELATIQVCLAYVDAQREYYSRGQGLLEYAQRLDSTKGKRDGLYWETRPGELDSPLGPLVARHMIGGFALVAYPASYGASGIMTFIVNQDGVVYQKDLGSKTAQAANAMKTYNPDRTWAEADGGSTKR
jgi:hypothetical protein